MSHIWRAFFSLACLELHRIAFPVVSESGVKIILVSEWGITPSLVHSVSIGQALPHAYDG